MKKEEFKAIATLVGTVIGIGIFGLPYIMYKSGFLTGLFVLILVGLLMCLVNLLLGEVVLRTEGKHQLTGYAEVYLGKTGKHLMLFSLLMGVYGALIGYTIHEGEVLFSLFGVLSPLAFSIIFLFLCSSIIYKGIKTTGVFELVFTSVMLFVLLVICFFSFNKISIQNLTVFNPNLLFYSYGMIIFSYIGTIAIPEMSEIIKNKKNLKRAIIIGSVIPILCYVLFTFSVTGIVGSNFDLLSIEERGATIALKNFVSPLMGLLANILAVCTMFTAFISIGTGLMEVYVYDYKFNRQFAFLMLLLVPILFLFFGLTDFMKIIIFAGAISAGVDGILIVLMHEKSKVAGKHYSIYSIPKNTFIYWFLILLFLAGMIYQFI